MFKKWLLISSMISKNIDGFSDIECPHCGKKELDYIYIGDEKERVGYFQVWCNNCLHGIYISRATIPKNAKMLSFDTDVKLSEIIPQYKRIEPND
jgi:ribosomal protein S27E